MFIFRRLPLLILLLVLSSPAYTQNWDLPTVLDRLIHTYGGEKNLRKMDNMVQEWVVVAAMGNRHGTDIRSIRAPHQLRVVLSYPQKTETRILNGNIAHTIFGDASPELVTGMQLDAMRLQLMRLYSPLMLRSKIDSMGLTENGDLLALSLAENGVRVHYLVNKENWHIEKVAGALMMKDREFQFLTEYSDFAVVEGVLVHHKENKFAGGVNTASLQLRKITFDTRIDDSQFKP
jgi:hypothetical protein